MNNKIIIFVGSSPGAGKSTLSDFLFHELMSHGIPTQWVYEEDVLHLDVFARFLKDFRSGHSSWIDLLLQAASEFVEECISSDAKFITDSIFPCYNWLFASGYPKERIESFSINLHRILIKLRPLIIYLNSDVETALKRAVAERGTKWLEDFISSMNTWAYHKDKPVHDISGVIEYFEKINQLTLELLSQWSCDMLILDTTRNTLDEVKTMILDYLSLSQRGKEYVVASDMLRKYVGVYESRDDVTPNQLVISLMDDILFINAYWPAGCRLIAESDVKFRLQGTNHRIEFDSDIRSNAPSRWLVYSCHGKTNIYEKIG